MTKIKFVCWTWGMSGVKQEVEDVIKILNTKEWTKEEALKIEKMFKKIEDEIENLKEIAENGY